MNYRKMETSNTRKTNKNKNIKHKKPNYPFNQHNSKNTRIAGKTTFSQIESKTRNKTKNQNTELKQKTPKTKPTQKQKG